MQSENTSNGITSQARLWIRNNFQDSDPSDPRYLKINSSVSNPDPHKEMPPG